VKGVFDVFIGGLEASTEGIIEELEECLVFGGERGVRGRLGGSFEGLEPDADLRRVVLEEDGRGEKSGDEG
jgi:hypothetical protein